MGRSLHYRPSSDRWSIPTVGCIDQSTRAKPMERSQAPKILRLAPDSMLVPSLRPFSTYASSVLFPFLSIYFYLGLQGSPCASLIHHRCASRTLHTWGLLLQKLKLFTWASRPTHVLYFRMYIFSPLYASI